MKRLRLVALACLMITGCARTATKDARGFRYRFSIDEIETSNAPAEAAEKLAKGAEELLNAKGFEEAHKVASEALKLDPQNFRAGFIEALLAPVRAEKGVVARLQPLAQRSPYLMTEWSKVADAYRAKPDFRFNAYFMDGKPDITNEQEFQKFLDSEVAALEKFRAFLVSHRSGEITMIASPLFVPDLNQRYAYRCQIKETANRSYELECPPEAARREVSLNRADFESLIGGVIYYQIYLGYPNSFELAGTLEVLKNRRDVTSKNMQEITDALMIRPEFGALRANNTLGKTRVRAMDFVTGMTWAMENPKLTCPAGEDVRNNRPGFFFNQGYCISSIMGQFFRGREAAIAQSFTTGGPVRITWPLEKTTLSINQNLLAPLERPLANLKQLGPTKWDECGNWVDLKDKTMAGLFPDGDAPDFLRGIADCDVKK